MAPLLGGDLTQRVFLNRFAQLASDGLFHVRKILASNFGEFCAVVGQEITESVLVSCSLVFCFFLLLLIGSHLVDGQRVKLTVTLRCAASSWRSSTRCARTSCGACGRRAPRCS